jgi:hypothetical protein
VQVRADPLVPEVQARLEPVGYTKREVPAEKVILSLSADRIYDPGVKLNVLAPK